MNIFHRHKWIPTAVNSGQAFSQSWIVTGIPGDRVSEGVRTFVLYACECGENKTESFPGKWTLAQLSSPSSNGSGVTSETEDRKEK